MEVWAKMIQKLNDEKVSGDMDFNTFKKVFLSIV